ncbi:hypothetical protein DAPPUDRAFT_254591 [Daphnia pulex]|uniref:Uncharacterized protein n=1 Tax=Daphnia pulex TaxID=6669 RepID=E9H7E5_DAPPU|nr:hypothetical protein DAPPUDRAFT_254591 [Daphnia pulex]|eukprot:EFX72362.1 hypothetical protein DAPPUDRAFT_254591 [Daphnia pulex]
MVQQQQQVVISVQKSLHQDDYVLLAVAPSGCFTSPCKIYYDYGNPVPRKRR